MSKVKTKEKVYRPTAPPPKVIPKPVVALPVKRGMFVVDGHKELREYVDGPDGPVFVDKN